MTDEPMIPHCEIIDLDGVRIQRGQSRYNPDACKHKKLIYANSHVERRIWCEDCRKTIDPFEAFLMLSDRMGGMIRTIKDKMLKADAALGAVARLRAVKVLDKAWSGHVMAVSCPHCRAGLLPEDFANGANQSSREYELARRKKADDEKLR